MREFFFSRMKQLYGNRAPEEKRRLRRLLWAVIGIYALGVLCGLLLIFFLR